MAARGIISKNDGSFNSVAVGQSLYVRNKITANSICAAGMVSNELYVVGGRTVLESLKVSGDATFCGDVNVSGQTTVNNFFVSGNATFAQDLFVCGNTTLLGDLYVSGNTTLNGNLLVEGTVTLNQDLYVSGNTTLNSDLFVEGNTTLNGNLFVSGNTTLTNLFVEGSATLSELKVLGNTTLCGDLLVQGDTTLEGHLFAGSGATIDGNLKVSGDTSLCGDLDVTGNTNFGGDVFIEGDLGVSGNTTLYSDLLVKGDTTLSSLYVSGNTTLQGNFQVEGSATLNGGLYVSGNTTLNGDLRVFGDTTLSEDLFVKGNTTLAGNLYVSGGATINQNLKVVGDASLCSNLKVGLNTTMDGRLKVQGDVSLCSDAQVGLTLTVDGNAIVQGDLTVNGNTDLNQQLFVAGHTTLNSSLKVSGSATFCSDVMITGGTLITQDICVMPGFTLYTNDIAPKTGTMVTVGGPGDSLMVDRVNVRYIDGKFGGSITIATAVNVLGDLTVQGIICSTLPQSIVETNLLRSKNTSTTLTLGTAGEPKVVCIAQGNTLLAEHIIGKEGVGGLGLEICATTLQVEDIIPKAPNKSITLGVGTTTAVDGNLCVVGTVWGNQYSPKTGTGLTLGSGGDLVQVRDNMCVDGYLQSERYRAKENANTFTFERINGDDRATFDISNPPFKIITTQGISLCPSSGVVQVEGDIIANNFLAAGGAPAMIMADLIATDTIKTKNGDILTLQNQAGTDRMTVDYTTANTVISTSTGDLHFSAAGGDIQLQVGTQTRRLEPDVNNTRTIGTSALRYNTLFANTVNARTVRGPNSTGLTLYSDTGRFLLDTAGANVTLSSGGVGKDIWLAPSGASVITTRDLCVGKTLAVDTIIGKSGGAVTNFCASTVITDDLRLKSGTIMNVQNTVGTDILRFNVGPAQGPIVSSQSGLLRLSGATGISLQSDTTTRNLQPDVNGLRDVGTTALRYNEVFGQIGDYSTRVETPTVRNAAGDLGLVTGSGLVNVSRTGPGPITLDTGTFHFAITNNDAGFSLVAGETQIGRNLTVQNRLRSSTLTPKLGDKTVAIIAPTLAHTGKLACFTGTLQSNRLVNKDAFDMYIINTNDTAIDALHIQSRGAGHVIVGNRSHTIDKLSNSQRCGIFMGNNNGVTNNSANSAIIAGSNNQLSDADNSAILAGTSNSMSSNRGAVIGGSGNIVGGARNTVLGSENNACYGNRNCIVGGTQHIVAPNTLASSVSNSFIAGGVESRINDNVQSSGLLGARFSKLTSGFGNVTTRDAVVCGGDENAVRSSFSVIAGGVTNDIANTGISNFRNFIGGGFSNLINAADSAVLAGRLNLVGGNRNAVVAAQSSSVTGSSTDSLAAACLSNTIKGSAVRCALVGGQGNLIKGTTSNSAIIGGLNCSIAADVGTVTRSVILGGRDSTIASDDSMAIGRNCQITESTNIFLNADTTRRLKNGATANIDVPQNTGIIALQAEDQIYAFSNINFNATYNTVNLSDMKAKTDIEPLSLGLKDVLKMKPREFYYKVDEGKYLGHPKSVGFVAQELEEVDAGLVLRESNRRKKIEYRKRVQHLDDKTPLPEELFSTDVPEEEEQFGLVYSNLIPVLTQAIQDQNVEIEALKKRVTTLEGFHL